MNKLPHPAPISGASYSAVELALENDTVILLDQRRLPVDEVYIAVHDVETLVTSISEMWVRGAPAIGVAAAYGSVLAAQQAKDRLEFSQLLDKISLARPTAVNLRWAVERMRAVANSIPSEVPRDFVAELASHARRLHQDDVEANRCMGQWGAKYLPDGARVLTHCNAGALATGGYGTALGVIRAAVASGKRISVVADETRPWLQGARLTAWELVRDGIDVTVICDGAAASLFRARQIDLAVVGADRISARGDVANKIGTYGVACLCQHHQTPFYVAAPVSTIDMATASGSEIVIEERPSIEISHWGGRVHVPLGAKVKNPSFDVTPAELISAIFTERGVISPVRRNTITAVASG